MKRNRGLSADTMRRTRSHRSLLISRSGITLIIQSNRITAIMASISKKIGKIKIGAASLIFTVKSYHPRLKNLRNNAKSDIVTFSEHSRLNYKLIMELTPKFLRNFRCVLLVSSGIYSAVTLLTLSQGNDCPGSNIRIALWLTFSVQISAFTLLLMHFVYLGWLLKKCEKLLTFYYLYVILAMLSVQLLFFQSGSNGGTLPVPEQPQ